MYYIIIICSLILILIFIIFLVYYFYNSRNIEPTCNYIVPKSYILPKNIYMYWHDRTNKSVEENLKCWRNNIPEKWNIHFINNDNIDKYVSKKFIIDHKNLDPTKFSDFLRLELLYNNGGLWVDAFILLSNGYFIDNYRNEMILNNYDVTLYNFEVKNTYNTIYLENWFIMAPQYSKFIFDVKTEFDKSYNMGFLNYKKNILIPSKVDLTNTIGYGNATYLLQHAIINYLYHKGNKYNNNIKSASESMFKIQNKLNWNHKKISEVLLENNEWTNSIYAIKLVKTTRRFFTDDELITVIKMLN